MILATLLTLLGLLTGSGSNCGPVEPSPRLAANLPVSIALQGKSKSTKGKAPAARFEPFLGSLAEARAQAEARNVPLVPIDSRSSSTSECSL